MTGMTSLFVLASFLASAGAGPADWLNNQLGQQKHFRAEWEINGVWNSGKRIPKDTPYLRSWVHISRDNDNWKIKDSKRRTEFRRGKLSTTEEGEIYLVVNKTRYVTFTDGKFKIRPGHPVSYEPNYFSGGPIPPIPISGDFSPFLPGRTPITAIRWDEFLSPSNPVTITTRQGRDVFSYKTPHGIVTLSFDTRYGDSLSRVDVELGPDDKKGSGVKLKDIPEKHGGPMEFMRSSHRVTAFREVAGTYYPAEWEFHKNSKAADGEEEAFVNKVKLISLVINPTFDAREFDPAAHFPDGARVQVAGNETVAHEWRNGEIVKSINSTLADANYEFQPAEKSTTKTWLIVAGVGIVVAAIGLLTWWRRAAS